MIFCLKEEDGNSVLELDEEGIEYLEGGLEQLRADGVVSSPALSDEGVGKMILRLVP